ncbi:GNAT family N-acetyltransferase [soil metagenome]
MTSIRPYHPEDIQAVYQLFYHSVHEVAKKDYNAQQLAAWAKPQRNPQRWDVELLEQRVWVAETAGEISGFITLRPEDGYLDFLYVHHLHQGKGIATLLLQALETEAGALDIHQLTTDSSLTARPFFLSKGFSLVAENIKTVDGVEFVNSRLAKQF